MDAPNIRLRNLEISDLHALVKQANNRKIWLNLRNMFPHPYTESDGQNFIKMVQSDDNNTRFAIAYNDQFAGMIGLFPQSDVYQYNSEIGYWIGEEYWGKGIGTEAVRLITEYGFSETETQRIFAGIFSYNTPSMRVLKKNGYEKEGIHRKAVYKDGAFYDEIKYAKIRG